MDAFETEIKQKIGHQIDGFLPLANLVYI